MAPAQRSSSCETSNARVAVSAGAHGGMGKIHLKLNSRGDKLRKLLPKTMDLASVTSAVGCGWLMRVFSFLSVLFLILLGMGFCVSSNVGFFVLIGVCI